MNDALMYPRSESDALLILNSWLKSSTAYEPWMNFTSFEMVGNSPKFRVDPRPAQGCSLTSEEVQLAYRQAILNAFPSLGSGQAISLGL